MNETLDELEALASRAAVDDVSSNSNSAAHSELVVMTDGCDDGSPADRVAYAKLHQRLATPRVKNLRVTIILIGSGNSNTAFNADVRAPPPLCLPLRCGVCVLSPTAAAGLWRARVATDGCC